MTDAEVLEKLKIADNLLTEYQKIVDELLPYLSAQKSNFVFSKPDGYEGHLGCYESGIDTLCIHITDDAREWRDQNEDFSCYEWEREWAEKMIAAGINKIHISGHF